MIRAATAVGLLCAMPALAQQEADPEDVAAMTRAIEEAGCVVTVENGDEIMAASGLAPEQVNAVIAQLYASGALMLQQDSSAKLTNEACP
jgi:fructose-1,6-bisphosphatase/inositol monophosphatase family enzyme